jgi:hypothetical protein
LSGNLWGRNNNDEGTVDSNGRERDAQGNLTGDILDNRGNFVRSGGYVKDGSRYSQDGKYLGEYEGD